MFHTFAVEHSKFKELKRNMLKEVKEDVTISYQIENVNKEIRIIKNNQMKILELKSTISEMKNSWEWLNSRFEQTKEWVNLKIDWQGLCNLRNGGKEEWRKMNRASEKYGIICISNISVMGVLEGERGAEKTFEEIMAEHI